MGEIRERMPAGKLRWLMLAAAAYVLACIGLGVLLAEISLRLPHRAIGQAALFRERVRRQFGADVQAVNIAAADGAELRGWFVPAPHPNGRSVILLHGIGGNRVEMTGYGDIFLAQGYSVLLPDSREHGESGGRVATFGLLERDDVRRWTEWVRGRAPGCTYLLGESMGAAIAVQATAVTPDLCAVAVEDPYANFRQVAYERLGRETRLGSTFWRTLGAPVIETAILWAHWRYRVWLPDAAPGKTIERSHVPVLLMTGTADQSIPMHHAEELEQDCGSRCALWIVPGAAHGGISTVTGAEFGRRILLWFAAHDDSPGPRPNPRSYAAGL